MKKFLAVMGSAVMGTMFTTVADATVEPVTAEVTFAGAIGITEVNALQFGVLDVGMANLDTLIINTDDTFVDSASNIIGGTQAAAELTITATALVTLSILVDTIVSGSGYTLDTFVCNYEGGGDADCDGPGTYQPTSVASGTLEIGAKITGDGSASAGAANGSFNVTVIYQ